MKAFLLAAGIGTRLRPLTDRIPKCLAPIRGKPLLGIWLDLCRKHGITEVFINVHAHPDAVREWVAQHSDWLSVRVFEEPVLLGSAGTIAANREWVEAEPFFWVLYADVLTNADLSKMLAFHQSRNAAATLGVYAVSNPSECGIAVVDENNVILQFAEKSANPSGNLAFSGLMLATRELLDAIPSRIPVDLGFDVIPRLVGRMLAFPIREFLMDVGTLEKYARAQATWPGL